MVYPPKPRLKLLISAERSAGVKLAIRSGVGGRVSERDRVRTFRDGGAAVDDALLASLA